MERRSHASSTLSIGPRANRLQRGALQRGTLQRGTLAALLACLGLLSAIRADESPSRADETGWIQAGTLHEAIGQGQHQGRLDLAEVEAMPGVYGVGALEGLRGEITVVDSRAIVTRVAADGSLESVDSGRATLFAGQSVDAWVEIRLTDDVTPDRVDERLATLAASRGLDPGQPFAFVLEGSFEVHAHVINGACPIRARAQGLELDDGARPHRLETASIEGTVVGLYAADAGGRLTHHGTSTHAHLVYVDEATGEEVTGHLESVGWGRGTVLKLPASLVK